MANYTHKGTKITGTSTSGKVFAKSGVKKAKKNDTYLNKQTGHVYQCTDAGKKGSAKEAKWKYIRTDIVKKPSVAVSSLAAPTRSSGHTMNATWKTPSAMIDPKKGDRVTDLDVHWTIGVSGKKPVLHIPLNNEKATSSHINLDNVKIGNKTYRRSDFYPFKGKPTLHYITAKVVCKNAKGKGASVQSTRPFVIPRAPVISGFTFNGETGELSCTVNTNVGTDYRERYDTVYRMTVYYSNTKKTSVVHNGATTATSIALRFDDVAYASRKEGDFAKVVVTAYARGYRGNSGTVSRSFYISYPARATIRSVVTPSKQRGEKCIIYLKTNSTIPHPVDRVKLEYLPNCEWAAASQIPGDADWQTTDIIDDAQCTAMSVSVNNLIPDRGNYTWVRLKTYHAHEAVLYLYSNYVRVKGLETPEATAADDKITIISATPGADGQSAVISLVWDDGTPVSTGTELSWSTSEDSWKSTKDPDKYEFTWTEGRKVYDGKTWQGSATITIKGLEDGEKYYVKARRYNEGDKTTYSEYSNVATVLTSERPESVTATADRYVPKGSGLNVYWTFSGNGLQKNWQIVKGTETVIAEGEGTLGSTQISGERLASLAENGSLSFTVQVSTGSGWVVSEEKTVTLIDKPMLSITAPQTMTEQPYEFTAVASVPSDLVVIVTSQGATSQYPVGMLRQTEGDTIHSNVYSPEWIAGYVRTNDTSYQDKRYFEKQGDNYTLVIPEGEEGVIDPTINPTSEGWYEEIDGVSTTITLPPQLDFWDLGKYTIEVTAIDNQTLLRSEAVTSTFSVGWAHQAPSPQSVISYSLTIDTEVDDDKNYYSYDSTTQVYTVVVAEGDEDPSAEGWYEQSTQRFVTLTPIDNVDESGFHHLAVQIALTPPPNAIESDVYDIYRMTGDGARLIGSGFPLTHTAVDEYAPLGQDLTNSYRIAVRTADGDVAFSDFEYVLETEGLRLDWAGGYVEYPYGVSIGDSYSKDVDVRKHLDGSIAGYWNQGVERKQSLNTDLIKIIQQDDIETTRQLARYTGPVFVRTKEGTAFEADVQVTDLSMKNIAVMTVAIDANEIDLTEEFMLPTPFVIEESEGE